MDYRSPLRFLAPVALIAVIVAIFLMVGSLTGSGGSGTKAGNGSSSSLSAKEKQRRRDRRRSRLAQKTYTVKPGDSLDAIAIKTGVSKATLMTLNKGIDPQALQPGQKLKLR